MAEKDDDSLIGYDPLAWMNDGSEESIQPSLSLEVQSDHEPFEKQELNLQIKGSQAIALETELDPRQIEVAELDTGNNSIILESILNIQNVAQLHERLVRALDSGAKIEIDASAVTMIDTSTLQLLLVLKQTAIKLQNEVVIDFPSDRFIEAATLLGLAEMLEVDQAAAGFF